MKLLLTELASEEILQTEIKTFTSDEFVDVFQAYLNAGLLHSDKIQDENEL